MPFLSDTVICFDLDDTLYKEIDYLKSAYREIAMSVGHPEAAVRMLDWYYAKENAFEKLIETYGLSITITDCLKIYRNHFPEISLDAGVKEFLVELKDNGAKLGLISDGRSITQRNKIKALGWAKGTTRATINSMTGVLQTGIDSDYSDNDYNLKFNGDDDNIIISEEFGSEKPSLKNYQVVMDKFSEQQKFIYVGDNPAKDFIAPNQLGWDSVCLLDDGRNIHKQDFDLPKGYLPKERIVVLIDLRFTINCNS